MDTDYSFSLLEFNYLLFIFGGYFFSFRYEGFSISNVYEDFIFFMGTN